MSPLAGAAARLRAGWGRAQQAAAQVPLLRLAAALDGLEAAGLEALEAEHALATARALHDAAALTGAHQPDADLIAAQGRHDRAQRARRRAAAAFAKHRRRLEGRVALDPRALDAVERTLRDR